MKYCPQAFPDALSDALSENGSEYHGESRPYFRCHPLAATLSLAQCRLNRGKMAYAEAFEQFDVMPENLQPSQCAGCTLAPLVEGGLVPLYSQAEVLAGAARQELPPAMPWSRMAPGQSAANSAYPG